MATIAPSLLQRRQEPDDEQLLKLFWNRAELKKELARLRREKDRLTDQLRQQEALNLRGQQRLEQLENLLADPVQAANALIYYQLRGLWQQARRRLVRLARELAERQHEREERFARQQFQQVRDGELALIDERLADADRRVRIVKHDLVNLDQRLGALAGFWNYFRRRPLLDQRAAVGAALEGASAQLARIEEERRAKEAEAAPAFAGLGVEGRRNINLAIIAMAQQLLVILAEGDVAALAREASARSLADVAYGDVARCQDLARLIQAAGARLDASDRLPVLVRRRAEYLQHVARYRRDSETVPMAAQLGHVPRAITEQGEARPVDGQAIPVNVLAEEYWDVCSVLLD